MVTKKSDLKNQGNLMLAGKEKRKRWSMPKVEIRGMFNFQGFFYVSFLALELVT